QLYADWLVAPDFFEVGVLADAGLHAVYDDVAKVEQDPLAGILAFVRDDGYLAALGAFGHAFSQGTRLAVGCATGNDHSIEKAGDMGGVEHLDVLSLDVFESVDDQPLQFLYIHGMTIT